MKNKYKARVYSLLVFPGAGHFVLHYWLRGFLFVIPFLWALGVVAYFLWNQAVDVMMLILEGDVQPDYASIYQALHEQQAGVALPYNLAVGLLLVTWVGAAVDAWILSNREEIQPESE